MTTTFRFVSVPSAISGGPAGWATELLSEGEIAVLSTEGLDAVNRLAHALARPALTVIRAEESAEAHDQTVITYAGALPLVWVAPSFSAAAETWARERGPMTLLVESGDPLTEDQRGRIDRFVQVLSRQSE